MRIVIDTNILVSAILFGGLPEKFMRALTLEKFTACVSPEILEEYNRTIPKLYIKYSSKNPRFELNDLISVMELITPTSHIDICRDKEDNKFIECAIDGKCIYIVSGDKDLLAVKDFNSVEILTVQEFYAKYLA